MLNYAVCEISGKQYLLYADTPLDVDFLGEDQKRIDVSILLSSEDGKIKLGNPYLKEKLSLDVVESIRGEKIRVAKFHAKANYRKVRGHRSKLTRVVFSAKK